MSDIAQNSDYLWLAGLLKRQYNFETTALILLHQRAGQAVFRVETEANAVYALRLCPASRPRPRLDADVAVLNFLQEHNFPAPLIIPTTSGESYFEWEPNSFGYLQTFIEGVRPNLDEIVLGKLAQIIARLHGLAPDYEDLPYKVNWLADRSTAIRRAIDAQKNPAWSQPATEVLQVLTALPDLRPLPQGLIHTDIHEANLILRPDGELVLVDWEDAGRDAALLDLALLLCWQCTQPEQSQLQLLIPAALRPKPSRYRFDEILCRTVLQNYQQVRPLTPSEGRLLGATVKFLMGWFATRDMEREIAQPGVSNGLVNFCLVVLRSTTPEVEQTLTAWAQATNPTPPE